MCAAGVTAVTIPPEIRAIVIVLQVVVLTAPALTLETKHSAKSEREAFVLSLLLSSIAGFLKAGTHDTGPM